MNNFCINLNCKLHWSVFFLHLLTKRICRNKINICICVLFPLSKVLIFLFVDFCQVTYCNHLCGFNFFPASFTLSFLSNNCFSTLFHNYFFFCTSKQGEKIQPTKKSIPLFKQMYLLFHYILNSLCTHLWVLILYNLSTRECSVQENRKKITAFF